MSENIKILNNLRAAKDQGQLSEADFNAEKLKQLGANGVWFYNGTAGSDEGLLSLEVAERVEKAPESEHYVWREGMTDWSTPQSQSQIQNALEELRAAANATADLSPSEDVSSESLEHLKQLQSEVSEIFSIVSGLKARQKQLEDELAATQAELQDCRRKQGSYESLRQEFAELSEQFDGLLRQREAEAAAPPKKTVNEAPPPKIQTNKAPPKPAQVQAAPPKPSPKPAEVKVAAAKPAPPPKPALKVDIPEEPKTVKPSSPEPVIPKESFFDFD